MLSISVSHVCFEKIVIAAVGDGGNPFKSLSSHDNAASYSCYPQRRKLERVSSMFGGYTNQRMVSKILRSPARGCFVY